ncbi:hypothetical protein SAMN00790413_04114 [Deinococcus hopiensis KR-140]|uniref:Uncharacterized protein n=1 Tax=Deinococcus hopiensis KR-140 TaxID=695939 RepID=A0A1W1UNK0_9DEIO|nr:hypothetical protein SAMN00790413_04114 [Deinococcus hopiensis KR-140]
MDGLFKAFGLTGPYGEERPEEAEALATFKTTRRFGDDGALPSTLPSHPHTPVPACWGGHRSSTRAKNATGG